MRFQFIEDHRTEFAVIRRCKVLAVSPSGYYAWRGRPASKREMANQELTAKIKKAFEESGETYGSPRIYQVMRKHGLLCGKIRIEWRVS
jgi:putative transposase